MNVSQAYLSRSDRIPSGKAKDRSGMPAADRKLTVQAWLQVTPYTRQGRIAGHLRASDDTECVFPSATTRLCVTGLS